MRKASILIAFLCLPVLVVAQSTGVVQNHSYLGGKKAITSGTNSTNYSNGIIPGASITVYLTNTTTKATIQTVTGGVLANPFFSNAATAVDPGGFVFRAATNVGYDVVASGGGGNASCTIQPNCYAFPVTLLTGVYASSSVAPVVNPLAVQTNGVGNADQTVLNHVDTATVKFTNPSGGVESATVPTAANLSLGVAGCDGSTTLCSGGIVSAVPTGFLQMKVSGAPATQFVIVRPSAGTASCASGTVCDIGPTSGLINWQCVGVFCNLAPDTTADWVYTGSVLPAGVSAGSVTNVYAYAISSSYSDVHNPIGSTFTCNSHGVGGSGTTWIQGQTTTSALAGINGTNFTGVTCHADLIAGGAPGPSGLTLSLPDIGLIVEYTGTPATTPPAIYVQTPLWYNPSIATLGIDATGFVSSLTTTGTSGAATLSQGVLNVPQYSGGTTTNALTAAATGGAAPGTTFNGSVARTFDYHSFGAPGISGTPTTGNCVDWASATTLGDTGSPCGASAFSALTGGTNTTAAMLVGSGASFGPTGTGTIQATNIASTVAVSSPITVTGSGTVGSPYTIACPTCGTSSGGTNVSQNSGSAITNLPITGFMPQFCSDTSGSGTAQSCTVANTFVPQTGNTIVYSTTTTNSGTGLTINVNSLGAKSVAIPGSSGWTTTLTANIIPANKPLILSYDGTNWNMQQTGTVSAGGSGAETNITCSITWTGATCASGVTTISGSPTSITASSIPAGYNHLKIIYQFLGTAGGGPDTWVQVNGDTTSNYTWSRFLYDTGTSTANSNSDTAMQLQDSSGATDPTQGQMFIPFYTSGFRKGFSNMPITVGNIGVYSGKTGTTEGTWGGTAAITSLKWFFLTSAVFTIANITVYGVN